MPAAADDWRRTSPGVPTGTQLRWREYVAPRPDRDHDHCMYCWAKFVPRAEEGKERNENTISFEGYATVKSSGSGFDWVCGPCFDDFADEFNFAVVGDGRPDA